MQLKYQLLNYLFMESNSADRAQLLDEVSNYFLWLTPSHHEVAVTQINTHMISPC